MCYPLSYPFQTIHFLSNTTKVFQNINCDFVTKCVDSGMSVSPPQCKHCVFNLIANKNACTIFVSIISILKCCFMIHRVYKLVKKHLHDSMNSKLKQ